jgi:crossover junction endodeoxyribonuclease RuvC
MGIDPGLAKIGWGVIKTDGINNPVLVEYGCLSTPTSQSFSVRLDYIYTEICKLVETYNPEEVSVEQIFFASNAKTAINVAHARGAILLACSHLKTKVYEYTPLQIKQAVVGYGRAEKQQVQFMVKNLLGLNELPSPDHSADALAAAMCHNNARKISNIIKGT